MNSTETAPEVASASGHGSPQSRTGVERDHRRWRASLETVIELLLMEQGAEEITKAVIDAAKGGDLMAARLVIERLAPPLRERPINIDLPDTRTADGCVEAQGAILQAVGMGELLPGEGATLAGIVENRRRSIETLELEQRITALEATKK